MPFRERLKKAFKSSSSDSSTSSLSKSTTSNGKGDASWPSHIYAPGEPMPRPKYRAPAKKEHTEKLESFNFGDAWRRRSFVSEYSPHGSRMPSRRGSLMSRKSFGGRSMRSIGRPSLARGDSSEGKKSIGGGAVKDEDSRDVESREMTENGPPVKKQYGVARPTRLSVEVEQEGDDDVANVGLSRVQSRERPLESAPLSRQRSEETKAGADMLHQPLNAAVAHDHRPFTEEDLVLAMKRSHLAVPGKK